MGVRLQCRSTVHVKCTPAFNWCHVESSPDHAKVPQSIGSLQFNPSNWKIIVGWGPSNHQIVMRGKKGVIAFFCTAIVNLLVLHLKSLEYPCIALHHIGDLPWSITMTTKESIITLKGKGPKSQGSIFSFFWPLLYCWCSTQNRRSGRASRSTTASLWRCGLIYDADTIWEKVSPRLGLPQF